MATRLKIVEQLGTDLDAPKVSDFDQGLQQSTTLLEFDTTPTRKQHAGRTAERQRYFLATLAYIHAVQPL